jgi:membrane protein implicated in regulation of membrane protease activity
MTGPSCHNRQASARVLRETRPPAAEYVGPEDMMSLFVRITAVVAVAVVALILLAFVLKIVIFAAIVAAFVVAGLAVYNVFRRRRAQPPVVTYTSRR